LKKRYFGFILILVVLFLVVSCSENDNKEKDANSNEDNNDVVMNDNHADESEEPEEATVSLMVHWDEETFERTFNQHVKKALPHITLTYIHNDGQIEENFAKGIVPDIVMGSNFSYFKEIGLLRDQMPLIEKHGFDLDLYEEGVIETLKNASIEGEINALPVFRPGYVVAYNKDIFDAFGVPYPEDHLTWDEAIELGRQLSGERDGRKYHGLWPSRDQLSQVGATILDPATDEPNILDNDELRIFLERQ